MILFLRVLFRTIKIPYEILYSTFISDEIIFIMIKNNEILLLHIDDKE